MAPEDLLEAILAVWKEDPMQAINITQLAKRLQRNRREVTGALEILLELGLLKSTNRRKTWIEYRFNTHFTHTSLQDRLNGLLPPETGYQPLHLTYEEWKNAMKPIIQALLPPERLRWYIANLADYSSPHAFARTIYQEGYQRKWSPTLSELEREYLAMKLEDLLEYGAYQFTMRSVLEYFQEYLDTEGE